MLFAHISAIADFMTVKENLVPVGLQVVLHFN